MSASNGKKQQPDFRIQCEKLHLTRFIDVVWCVLWVDLPKKLTIRHSHPLHTVIGQLCRGEEGGRVWVLFLSLFFKYLKPSAPLLLHKWYPSSLTLPSRVVVQIRYERSLTASHPFTMTSFVKIKSPWSDEIVRTLVNWILYVKSADCPWKEWMWPVERCH